MYKANIEIVTNNERQNDRSCDHDKVCYGDCELEDPGSHRKEAGVVSRYGIKEHRGGRVADGKHIMEYTSALE